MKNAEFVTFGGGGLNRAAHLRSAPDALRELWHDGAQVLMFWQGKPLVRRETQDHAPDRLVWLKSSQDLVTHRFENAVFLGVDGEDKGLFAVDLNDWKPVNADEAQIGSFSDPSLQHHPDLPDTDVFAEMRSFMSVLSPFDAEVASTAKAVLAWHESHGFCARCGHETKIAEGGWQRKCPSCGTSHFPRTDPVVIMLITHGDRVLLGRSPGWPEGMYSLLAGFVEPGETLEAAVRREVFEETAVRVGEVGYLASQPWAFPMSLMFGCYGKATSEEIQIDPNEIEHAVWLTRQEVMESQAGLNPNVKPARKGAIARFLLDNWLSDTLD